MDTTRCCFTAPLTFAPVKVRTGAKPLGLCSLQVWFVRYAECVSAGAAFYAMEYHGLLTKTSLGLARSCQVAPLPESVVPSCFPGPLVECLACSVGRTVASWMHADNSMLITSPFLQPGDGVNYGHP